MRRSRFPVWPVVVAIVTAVWVSGRGAELPQLFTVEVSGRGRPVLLVPGLATSGDIWDGTVAALRDRHELHVLTLAGFGGPPAVARPFLPRVARALVEYVDERHLEAPVIVGHSLGGFVAMQAASACPTTFAGVVSVDGVPYLPALANGAATPDGVRRQADAIRAMYAGLSPAQLRQQTAVALERMVTSPDDQARALASTAKADPSAVGTAVAEMMTLDGRPALARMTAPLLLIGALGATPPALRDAAREAYRAQVAAAPDATVVFADEARHFVMLDDPAFLQRTIERFLAEAPRDAAMPCELDAEGR